MGAFERHYSVQEIAEMWGLGDDSVRQIFRKEPGVIVLGKGVRRGSRGYIRGRFHMRIPESVVMRVHAQLTGKPVDER